MKKIVLVAVIAFLVSVASAWGAAEVSLYGGASSTRDAEARVAVSDETATERLNLDSAAVFGGRVTYWFPSYSLGIALDASTFKPSEFVRGTFVTPLLLVRYEAKQYRSARLYAGAGPSLAHSRAKLPVEDEADVTICCETIVLSDKFYSQTIDLGVKAVAGLSVPIVAGRYGALRLFGEYQFTHVRPSFEASVFETRTSLQADVNTHHVVGGLSYEWGK